MSNKTVSREEWLVAREALLHEEKEFTRARDALNKRRRALPRVRVEKNYCFNGENGEETLADLFGGCSQLIIYHFMYGPDWEQACPSCSFWADNFNGTDIHLKHRDIALVAVSRAPWAVLRDCKQRMGWTFKWVSSYGGDFNTDYHVSFTAAQVAEEESYYNYRRAKRNAEELPGVSVFYRDEQGNIFHTYSAYARGLDMLNGAYHFMDIAPKGRDEDDLPYKQAWLRRHNEYEN